MLFDRNKDWLDTVIDMRDRVNHYLEGGLPIEHFNVRKVTRNDKQKVIVPMWSTSQTLRSALEVVWARLISFCEDFIGIFLFARLRLGFTFKHLDRAEAGALSLWRIGMIMPNQDGTETYLYEESCEFMSPEDEADSWPEKAE